MNPVGGVTWRYATTTMPDLGLAGTGTEKPGPGWSMEHGAWRVPMYVVNLCVGVMRMYCITRMAFVPIRVLHTVYTNPNPRCEAETKQRQLFIFFSFLLLSFFLSFFLPFPLCQ